MIHHYLCYKSLDFFIKSLKIAFKIEAYPPNYETIQKKLQQQTK